MEFNVNFDRSYNAPRIVKTVFDLEEANTYISEGRIVLFKSVKTNRKLYSKGYLFKHRQTGQCRIEQARQFPIQYAGWEELSEDEWEQILPVKDYARARTLEHDWAGYVLPLEPRLGEIFYIEDLIEDIFVSEFWGSKIYAVDGIASWNGSELKLRRDLYRSSECYIVG